MAQDGEINLDKLKACYTIQDIVLVDIREFESLNNARLYFEISFAISLTIFGSILTKFDLSLFISGSAFLIFGLFNLIKFILENNKIKNNNFNKK